MKKMVLKAFILPAFVALFSASSFGQDRVKQKVNDANGQPSLVVFSKTTSYTMQDVNAVLNEQLKTKNDDSFVQIKSETDNIGYTHQKYQQHYNGIPVEFATYTLHGKSGKLVSISGEYYDLNQINTSAVISKSQGLQLAKNHIGAQSYLWENVAAASQMGYAHPTGELVLLPNLDKQGKDKTNNAQLAYKYDIYATQPVSRGDLYIDAITGEALFYNSIIKHVGEHSNSSKNLGAIEDHCATESTVAFRAVGNAATRYSGTQQITTRIVGSSYALRDNTRGSGINTYNSGGQNSYPTTNFTDGNNDWTVAEFNNSAKDNAALDAHWGAERTYDYLSNVHARNSYNGSGAAINSWVHYDNIPGGAGYDNAFWNGSVMTYGDGSSNGNEGNGNFDALTSLDVAAHEIGHAVTSSTANLAYQRESGGLNEGFSDIWGAAVEYYADGNTGTPDANTWLIGEDIDRRTGVSALRSMSNPNSRSQPDTYGGSFWKNPNCGTPTQANDYCGVHTNSGVLNYWFYLSVVGGNGTNDVGNTFSVSAIGMDKSAKIAYRTLTQYLSANSTFANARTGSIQSAIDLYGAGGAEEIAVTNAWHAVGVGAAYATGGGGGGTSYCASNGNNTNDEYISRVQLGSIDKTSGVGSTSTGYSDFTNTSTTLSKGASATITITPTWPGTVYDEGYAVFIDYNQDGDFADAGETVWTKAASKTTPVSGSFTVPTGATDGETRMRVSMKYNGVPTSCESFQYGEVEDYKITIGGSTADTQAPSVPTNLSASGTTQTTTDLSWTASTDNVGVTEYEVFSGSASIGTVTGTSANITGLTANTTYSYTVRAKDAAGNTSAASNTVNVTTSAAADTQAPSAPTSLTASGTTQTTTDLSWTASTDNVGVTEYEVFSGSASLGTVTGTSANVTGLTANTSYSYTVRAKDAAGNTSASSNTVNVTTLPETTSGGCTGGISSFPYSEGFESGLGAWTQSTADNINWTVDASGTPSGSTGPSSASQGSNYIYVEASVQGTGYPNARAILNSPCFNLSSATTANFSFKYHMYGAADMGSIALEASTDNGASWTSLWSQTGNKGNSWLDANVDLAAYLGFSVQLRFNRLTGGTWQADIALDDINLSDAAPSADPCAGVAAWSSTGSYSAGDRVTYQGNLFERTASGWTNLGACGALVFGLTADLDVKYPPYLEVSIYPNPVKGNVLHVKSNESVPYTVVNMLGQEVANGNSTANGVNVGGLEAGLYMIQFKANNEVITKKFIKQ